MSIHKFAEDLTKALSQRPLPKVFINEQDFEQALIVPLAAEMVARYSTVLLYTHPFGNMICCSPDCTEILPVKPGRVLGCPKCWSASKAWASVAAFGTHHTFDLVAKDDTHTLAVELKMVTVKGGRMPNGEMQRFLGQCTLAASKHTIVIGVFAHRGHLNVKWNRETEAVAKWLEDQNVHLVFRIIE